VTTTSPIPKQNNGFVDAKYVDVNNNPKHHPQQQRRRSLSVATGQPSVETVIVKAKRAASSLWMLLHAQVRYTPKKIRVMLIAPR